MRYPTMNQVDMADREQLAKWFRFLPIAKFDFELDIINKINDKFLSMGGFTPELSKKIGWS